MLIFSIDANNRRECYMKVTIADYLDAHQFGPNSTVRFFFKFFELTIQKRKGEA